MEIASKSKIRYVFSHFLRRALLPVHDSWIHRGATRGIRLTLMAWIRHTHAQFLASTNARFYKELDRETVTINGFKLSARLPIGSQKLFIKGSMPCTFQATNEVMFLSWSLIKRQNTFFRNTLY